MGKIIDLTGHKFGRLTVLEVAGRDRYRNTRFKCKCECGKEKTINGASLRKGLTKSCGCLQKEITRKVFITHGKTINYKRHRLHSIWHGMKNRCLNPNTSNYHLYGGRDIGICDEWVNDFKSFYKWAVSNGYREDLTIDRINNDKGYMPSNCRWATYLQQRHNQRTKVS